MDARVAIVGAGPIGIEMAVGALKRAGVSYVHFDGKQVGYTVSWFAPGTHFFSSNERIAIAGVPLQTADQGKATREEYLAYLRAVVMQFGLSIKTYEAVVGIERMVEGSTGETPVVRGGGFLLTTDSNRGKQSYEVEKVVLATGGTARPRMLNVPGEELPHVSHYFFDPHIYFGKKLLIVGGKNSAVEAALRCYGAGAKVSLVHRGEKLPEKSIKYWLLPEMNGLIESGKIEGRFLTRVMGIGEGWVEIEKVESVASLEKGRPAVGQHFTPHPGPLPQGERGQEKREKVEADFVLLLVGYEADMSLCEMAGVKLLGEERRPWFNEGTMETNVAGIYVAGTAVAGTQDGFKVFIENSHVHVERILGAILGEKREVRGVEYERPES